MCLRRVEVVDFSNNEIDDEGMSMISKSIGINYKAITNLKLNENRITDVGFKTLLRAL